MKAEARAVGEDIIDLGMGNPDGATPQHIVDKLVESVKDPKTHRYSNSRGIPPGLPFRSSEVESSHK